MNAAQRIVRAESIFFTCAAVIVVSILALFAFLGAQGLSIASDTLSSVPVSLREGAEALGATRWQTIYKVLLRATTSGLLTALILGIGRAVGETMAVQMVVGNITQSVPPNLVTGATTMPAAIVTQLPEASLPPHHTALIMVAFLLLVITFLLIVVVRLFSNRRPRARATTRVATATTAAAAPVAAKVGGA